MPTLRYAGRSLPVRPGESVLDTLLSTQCEIPNRCRAGVCQSCLMQLVEGQVDGTAQRGLKDSWRVKGLFLACQCYPAADLEIRLPAREAVQVRCRVTAHHRLSDRLVVIRLRPEQDFTYRPGQHVTLWQNERLGRCYSLASVPAQDGEELELHVKRIKGGALSPWLYDSLRVGDRLQVQGPGGDCFYPAGDGGRRLLLAGVGTGLAPLYGILRDALRQGHDGEIHLYHGALEATGLYLHQALSRMAARHPNLYYHPCTLDTPPTDDGGVRQADLAALLAHEQADLRDWKVYLCGDAAFVNAQRRRCYLAGARLQDIHVDSFVPG
jgi:ferredoxin-NADP reductase/ferredoxin